jgi:iron complex transport system substrate-binding protein
MGGYNVTVPVTINRIVVTCQGGVTQEIAALGGADKIVGQPSMAQFPTLLKLYPAFNNVTDSGSFANINVETILALEPDVVIASKSSSQTELYQKLVTAGIPVVGVNTGAADINTILTEFRMMGQLLNNSTQADKMINFWNTQLEVVADHLQSVPSENRTTVFYVRGGSITRTDTSWGQAFISTAGGINVAAVQAPSSEVNLEQLLEWNPDMIIICKTGSATSISFVTNSSQLQNLDAIKNNQVYMCPVGTFWWERPSPEAVLGITWLAHTMYPDQFADVDIYSIAKTFYQEFFNYNLSSSEFATMLSLTS